MKIGLCRCLLQYHKLNTLFETFLKELGVDYIFSDETNKKILEDSLRIADDENCLSIKLIFGHTLNLKGRCDKILIARIISLGSKTNVCPRFLLLPELISLVCGVEVLKVNINVKYYPLFFSFLNLGMKLGKNPFKVILAFLKAKRAYKEEIEKLREESQEILKNKNGKIKIAFLGHPYLLFDKFLNLGLLKRLKETDILFPEMAEGVSSLPPLYWSEERLNLNAAYYFMGKIDGVIMVSSFLCGTSSLCQEFILAKAKETKSPILQLVIDENLTETAVDTRIQAFLNTIKRRKKV